MYDIYEVVSNNALCSDIIRVLLNQGFLRKVERTVAPQKENVLLPVYAESECTYLRNGLPIESSIESIAKEFIGKVEDRKHWGKDLKIAVKEYGHDEVLKAFYEWAISQDNFLGPKPVFTFLKNIASVVGTVSKQVSSPALVRVDQRVAYVSDNKVFFSGDLRFRLSQLIKDYGEELVITAFETFYQDVEPKNIKWAHMEFIKRAPVMIETIKTQRAEQAKQALMVAQGYTKAREGVIEELEEDEDL
jgi:hypothetical protein